MEPHERIRRAADTLDELDGVPPEAVQLVDALVDQATRRLVLTGETVQEWRDVAETARTVDKTSGPAVAALMRAVLAAPTTPPPPSGWLSVDMATHDIAKTVAPDGAQTAA